MSHKVMLRMAIVAFLFLLVLTLLYHTETLGFNGSTGTKLHFVLPDLSIPFDDKGFKSIEAKQNSKISSNTITEILREEVSVLMTYKKGPLTTSLQEFVKHVATELEEEENLKYVTIGVTEKDADPESMEMTANGRLNFVEGDKESDIWESMLKNVTTKYVFVGASLDRVNFKWASLERSLQLLEGDQEVLAVGGALRNGTGHWTAGCWQARKHQYNLIFREGYEHSSDNCMHCSALYGGPGPFLARTKDLIALHYSLPVDLMFLNWFLDMSQHHPRSRMLLCPDIIHQTRENNWDLFQESDEGQEDWKKFATLQGVEGVTRFQPPKLLRSFDCDDVKITCNPWKAIKGSYLVPWCCHDHHNYLASAIDDASKKLNFSYILGGGSLMGAVKLKDFIPWDLDGDIYVDAKGVEIISDENSELNKYLESLDISVKKIDSELFTLWYKGFRLDLDLSNITEISKYGHTTKVQMLADKRWYTTFERPGSYLRDLYGNYMSHTQSWYAFQNNYDAHFHYEKLKGRKWMECSLEDSTLIAECLENYATDGSFDFTRPV